MSAGEPAYPFQSHVGFDVTDWSQDRAKVQLDLAAHHMNRHGIPHGGLHATLLDTAMGYAGCWTGDPERRQLCLTLNLNVNYIGVARGTRLIATGTRTGGGRTTFFAEGTLEDETGTLVARATGVFRLKTS